MIISREFVAITVVGTKHPILVTHKKTLTGELNPSERTYLYTHQKIRVATDGRLVRKNELLGVWEIKERDGTYTQCKIEKLDEYLTELRNITI